MTMLVRPCSQLYWLPRGRVSSGLYSGFINGNVMADVAGMCDSCFTCRMVAAFAGIYGSGVTMWWLFC